MVKNIHVSCSTWFQVLKNYVPYALKNNTDVPKLGNNSPPQGQSSVVAWNGGSRGGALNLKSILFQGFQDPDLYLDVSDWLYYHPILQP